MGEIIGSKSVLHNTYCVAPREGISGVRFVKKASREKPGKPGSSWLFQLRLSGFYMVFFVRDR